MTGYGSVRVLFGSVDMAAEFEEYVEAIPILARVARRRHQVATNTFAVVVEISYPRSRYHSVRSDIAREATALIDSWRADDGNKRVYGWLLLDGRAGQPNTLRTESQ